MGSARVWQKPDINSTLFPIEAMEKYRQHRPECFVDESGCIAHLQAGTRVIVTDVNKGEFWKGTVVSIFEEVRCSSDMFYETIEVKTDSGKLMFIGYKRDGGVVERSINLEVKVNEQEFPVRTMPHRDPHGRFVRRDAVVGSFAHADGLSHDD